MQIDQTSFGSAERLGSKGEAGGGPGGGGPGGGGPGPGRP